MRPQLFDYLEQMATDRWAWYGVRRLLRAVWIAALIMCIGLGGHLVWGWPLRLQLLGTIALAVIGFAVLLLLRPRMRPHKVARRLDRRFRLREQLTTAVEVAQTDPPPGSIAARLIEQAGRTTRQLQHLILQHQRFPWIEVFTFAAISLIAAGLFLLVGIGRPDLSNSAIPLPPLAQLQSPSQEFPMEPWQSPAGQPQPAPGSGQQAVQGGAKDNPVRPGDPRVLEALADALRDQGATRPAAEALDRGDINSAAQELRELADQAEQLSQDARNSLARNLQEAAQQIEQTNPGLADELRRSAEALRRSGQEAAQGLESLARAIEDLQRSSSSVAGDLSNDGAQQNQAEASQQGEQTEQGQQGQDGQGGSGAGSGPAGEQRAADPSQRLNVEGQPVQLETSGTGRIPAQPSDKPPTSSQTAPGLTEDSPRSSSGRVTSGADPLRVPLDERHVVQEYFTP